jgi:sulfate/thiosulfate transport system ATP-binding protein
MSFSEVNHISSQVSQIFIRPHDIKISKTQQESSLPAIIQRIVHLGWEIQLELKLRDRSMITAHLNREEFDCLNLAPGAKVYLQPRQVKQFHLVNC